MGVFGFLKQIAASWTDWLGDRDMEVALRQYLHKQNFYGDGARIFDLKLKAVKRPGWLQVFTFTAEVKSRLSEDAEKTLVFGILRQDERYDRCDIEVFDMPTKRDRLFAEWSKDLVRTRQAR